MMINSIYLAWRYIRFNRIKTFTLIACVTLITVLPVLLQLLLTESERQLMLRATSTPLVVGARGSALDLMMNTLYFGEDVPELLDMNAAEEVWGSGLAQAIPLYVRFRARERPIVGTTLEYFEFRGLKPARGRLLGILGECVVGAEVARQLGLEPGDTLLSSPETVFDLAGVYPLKMKVVGVLERAHNADDLAVFVDIKTAWVIQGLGHGHQDVVASEDDSVVLKRSDRNVVANAKLIEYTEINEANLDSFHFHGAPTAYPISAVIAVPNDDKSGAILRGRFVDAERRSQIAVPSDVIDELLQNIFRIKNVLDAVILIVGLATVLAIILVFALSLRLRQREVQTIFKLGCRRATIARLLTAEIALIILISGTLCTAVLWATQPFISDMVRLLFIR